MSNQIKIFDTTLRDGTQGERICFSAEDKLRIARRLDELGFHYIEGGWPGSNPRDMEFFRLAQKEKFHTARIVAFGSTARYGQAANEDPNLNALLDANTPAVSIFGKTWDLHVEEALGITLEDNLQLIFDSISYLKTNGKEVIYDAEHFFDGFKANPEYALKTLLTAEKAGADTIALCDTNGGSLPSEIANIVKKVSESVTCTLGIHAHNDGELAVANSLAAVEMGARHIQGTINGYGERCGNANLCSILPNATFKMGFDTISLSSLQKLTSTSRLVSELANVLPDSRLPYVGDSAFAHKGGIHVSAVLKNPKTYEHLDPEDVGNRRRVLISDLSGKSNLRFKAEELDLDMDANKDALPEIMKVLKQREFEGYSYEAAEASLNLLIRKITENHRDAVQLKGFRLLIEKNDDQGSRCEATIRVEANGVTEHTAAEGNGPVHALDKAFRKALIRFFPEIQHMQLEDYKVRVMNGKNSTAAKVRVLIDSSGGTETWSTVGVSENIIEASWEALSDSYSYFLAHHHKQQSSHSNIR